MDKIPDLRKKEPSKENSPKEDVKKKTVQEKQLDLIMPQLKKLCEGKVTYVYVTLNEVLDPEILKNLEEKGYDVSYNLFYNAYGGKNISCNVYIRNPTSKSKDDMVGEFLNVLKGENNTGSNEDVKMMANLFGKFIGNI